MNRGSLSIFRSVLDILIILGFSGGIRGFFALCGCPFGVLILFFSYFFFFSNWYCLVEINLVFDGYCGLLLINFGACWFGCVAIVFHGGGVMLWLFCDTNELHALMKFDCSSL